MCCRLGRWHSTQIIPLSACLTATLGSLNCVNWRVQRSPCQFFFGLKNSDFLPWILMSVLLWCSCRHHVVHGVGLTGVVNLSTFLVILSNFDKITHRMQYIHVLSAWPMTLYSNNTAVGLSDGNPGKSELCKLASTAKPLSIFFWLEKLIFFHESWCQFFYDAVVDTM